jgi:adenosine kinase
VVAAVGNDFSDYYRFLAGRGIDVEGISMWGDEMTASCFITTDKDDCQITGFYVGAMKRAREISLAETAGEAATAALVAPDDPEAMLRHCDEARQSDLPFLFDPSFQVTAMDGDALRRASEGATALFLNDYEFSVLQEKTGLTADQLRQRHPLLVVTLGEKGSELLLCDGETLAVPAAKVSEVVDPTGAGDAFRGGFAAGLMQGQDLATCGRMGSIAAAYAIECYGTQNHDYSRQQFEERYREAFGQSLPER